MSQQNRDAVIQQNQVISPGTVEQRQDFVKFLQSHPYYSDIWKDSFLEDYVSGNEESAFLNTLFNMYYSGDVQHVWNLIWSEGQHNLLNPLWTQWGH